MTEKFINRVDKAIAAIIKAVIIFLPLFFLPWTSEYFEFSKQFFLWLVMPIAALLWLGKTAASGQVKIKINPLNLPILIFLLLTALSAAFSLDRFSSFFGYFGRFSDAWLGLLSLALFYFLIINTEVATSAEKIVGLLKLLFYSSALVAVLSLAAMFGVLGMISGNPSSFFSSASFNLAGNSLFSLGIFLAVMSVVAANFLFWGDLKKFDRIFFSASLILFLLILGVIDFSLSRALLLIGSGLMIFFRLLATEFNFKKILNYYLLIPLALMLLAILMIFLPNLNLAKIILGKELPKEVLLEYGQSWTITKETLKKNPLLGSGPGTFSQDFSLFRPAEFNSGAFWQIRFDQSRSHFLELLATAGVLTGLSYFLIICLVLYLNIVLIRKYLAGQFRRNFSEASRRAGEAAVLKDENYNLIVVLFIIFILLFCAQLLFLTNTVLNFTFWFSLALIIAFWQRGDQPLFKEKIIDWRQPVLFYRLVILTGLILSAGVVALLVFETKFFVADILAARAANRETELVMAVKLNPYRYNYRISLAKLYLNQARIEALKPFDKIGNNKIQINITQAIETAKEALVLAPNSVLPKETLGMIYRDIRQLTQGSEPWAVKYFSEAFELEPTNPILATELAKAYLNASDLVNAEKYFKISLELKADYYEAKFGLAKTYLKNKQDSLALILLNQLASEVYSVEVYYELGRYYYNHGEIDKAIDRFKLALNIYPEHANSLYSLAVADEAKGEIKEALKYYQQVLKLDPANKAVEQKIKDLSE